MVGNPFPGFVGKPGTYPIDLELPAPEPQKRLVTFFRLWLAIPALLIAAGLYGALWTVAFLGWFVSLFLGRMPLGLRGLGAYALRYARPGERVPVPADTALPGLRPPAGSGLAVNPGSGLFGASLAPLAEPVGGRRELVRERVSVAAVDQGCVRVAEQGGDRVGTEAGGEQARRVGVAGVVQPREF